MKKTTRRHIIAEFLKTKDKGKILKAVREEKSLFVERSKHKNDGRLLVSDSATRGQWRSLGQVLKGETTASLEFYTQPQYSK